ncbi:MAG: hypothetical protein J7M19_05545 [Planctomycetes bacterium]|nr:hypothetical protein [Planctomycetota bacterium]
MNAGQKAKIISLATAVVCLALIVPVQSRIDAMRTQLVDEDVLPPQLPLAAASSAALGGFRGIAVDILWIQADSMITKKQFYQLKTYYELISTLQPNFPAVWEFNMWNLAFNIEAEWGRPEEKWKWIKEGIEFGKKGLEFNKGSASLNTWVGWLYYKKVNADGYFVKKMREEEKIEPYLESYKYFKRASDLLVEQGRDDQNERRLAARAIFEHGKVALAETGNVPEAMRSLDRAEKSSRALLAEFPEDMASESLLREVLVMKARLVR